MKRLLFILTTFSFLNTYSQRKFNEIYFILDTTLFNKNYPSKEIYFENNILKYIQPDSFNNRNLEFIRIDNKNYYLSITNNLGAVLEEGKVSISKKPFRKDGNFNCFYFQKNGYWRELLTDSIYQVGHYKFNKKNGIWTYFLKSNLIALFEKNYNEDKLINEINLNQLQGDSSVVFKTILGSWKAEIWDYLNQFWAFVKVKPNKNEYSETTLQIDKNYTAKIITRHHHGRITQNFKWSINSANNTIILEGIEKKVFIEIVYLKENILLLNSKPIAN